MRSPYRFTQNLGVFVLPAVCCAVTLYFGYGGLFGERGVLEWNRTEAQLAVRLRDLHQAHSERVALEHRIALMDDKALDPDLLEEVARAMLYQGRDGEVAVPRTMSKPN